MPDDSRTRPETYADVMPFIDALREATGGDMQITAISNSKTGDSMRTALDKEPSGGELNSEQYLKLGQVPDALESWERVKKDKQRAK